MKLIIVGYIPECARFAILSLFVSRKNFIIPYFIFDIVDKLSVFSECTFLY